MDDFCKKCGRCCRYIPADLGKKVLYRDGIKPLDDEFALLLNPADISNIDRDYQASLNLKRYGEMVLEQSVI
jgi:hypothetical protein